MKRSSPSTSICKRRSRSAAKRVLVYFDERSEVFRTALHAARAYFAVEGINDLRVEVKRLRILYELIDYMTPSFASKPNYSPLRDLFRAAGALRDIDICQAITLPRLKTLNLSEYFNHLKHEELRHRESFGNIATSFSDAALTKSRRQIYSALAIARGERLRRLMGKKISKLAGRVNNLMNYKKQSSGSLHAVRKMSKALRYILDIWQACYGKAARAAAAADQLKNTYDYLGEWRDTLITRESISAFLEREIRSGLADPPAYVTFQAGLRRREERLLAAYKRGKEPLRKSLEQLVLGLHKPPTR